MTAQFYIQLVYRAYILLFFLHSHPKTWLFSADPTVTLISYLFCPWQYVKKNTLKNRILYQNVSNRAAKMAQTVKFMFTNVAYGPQISRQMSLETHFWYGFSFLGHMGRSAQYWKKKLGQLWATFEGGFFMYS